MPYEGAMQEAFEKLSDEEQLAVFQYVQFLVSNPSVRVVIQKDPPAKRKLGLLADRFHGMSDQFNEPLPEFKEYM